MLGMYVHTHWSYNHPYAARRWTIEDWTRYLKGLRTLGYDFVMLWPQCDAMPPRPTPSDLAFLHKASQAIDVAHDLGMRFAIVAAANSIGNARSADYPFEERPYYLCEEHVNPRDPAAVRAFLEGRGRQFAPLARADALVIIDSDPGGYPGSTTEEFVAIARAQLDLFRRLNPEAMFYAWLWFGWRNQCEFVEAVAKGEPDPITRYFRNQDQAVGEELALLKDEIEEPWGVTVGLPCHVALTSKAPFAERRLFFPYGLIEGEPSFPLTNYYPDAIESCFADFGYSSAAYPHGAMANAQTHCLQLPNTHLFAHFAQGGTKEDVYLMGFGEKLLPGWGEELADAWRAIAYGEPREQRAIAREIRRCTSGAPKDDPTGLLFGDPERFLTDLAMNLEVRAGLQALDDAMENGRGEVEAVGELLRVLRPYQERLGFTDAYGGPLHSGLNARVGHFNDPAINAALKDFDDWQHPERRRVALTTLLDTLEVFCRKQGGSARKG